MNPVLDAVRNKALPLTLVEMQRLLGCLLADAEVIFHTTRGHEAASEMHRAYLALTAAGTHLANAERLGAPSLKFAPPAQPTTPTKS